jgi:hypothetical protein
LGVLAGLGGRVGGGVADREHGQGEAGDGVADAKEFGCRPQPVGGGQVTGGHSGDGDAEEAGGLVDAQGEAAAARSDQVDLHVDRHRPGQSLVRGVAAVAEKLQILLDHRDDMVVLVHDRPGDAAIEIDPLGPRHPGGTGGTSSSALLG